MRPPLRIGLLGFGRAGRATARVLLDDPCVDLQWVLRQSDELAGRNVAELLGSGSNDGATIRSIGATDLGSLFIDHPVDVVIDFSSAAALDTYAPVAISHGCAVVSAVSHYDQAAQDLLVQLGRRGRVVWSPNISLGINCLMVVAEALRTALPGADVAVVEEHFRDKAGVSGTALRLAARLSVDERHVTSLRLGGIVGTHSVVFGLPDQTIRLSHESTTRDAFGNGALFAARHVMRRPYGLYSMEDLLRRTLWPDSDAPLPASA